MNQLHSHNFHQFRSLIQVASSLNTTTGSVKSRSFNLTSSMSLPVYSNEYDNEDDDEVCVHYFIYNPFGGEFNGFLMQVSDLGLPWVYLKVVAVFAL